MDGWTDGRTGGWMVRWLDRWMDGWDGCMYGWMDVLTSWLLLKWSAIGLRFNGEETNCRILHILATTWWSVTDLPSISEAVAVVCTVLIKTWPHSIPVGWVFYGRGVGGRNLMLCIDRVRVGTDEWVPCECEWLDLREVEWSCSLGRGGGGY